MTIMRLCVLVIIGTTASSAFAESPPSGIKNSRSVSDYRRRIDSALGRVNARGIRHEATSLRLRALQLDAGQMSSARFEELKAANPGGTTAGLDDKALLSRLKTELRTKQVQYSQASVNAQMADHNYYRVVESLLIEGVHRGPRSGPHPLTVAESNRDSTAEAAQRLGYEVTALKSQIADLEHP